MSFRRSEYKLSLLVRDNAQRRAEIADAYDWVGPVRDPGYLHGRICPADWVRSRWSRWERTPRPGGRERIRRTTKRIVGEWRWVRV